MRIDGDPKELEPNVREADWSPDGSELAIIRQAGTGEQLEYPIGKVLYKIPGGYLSDPRVSPDGNQIAFFEHPIRWDDRGRVKVVDRSGASRTLSEEYWGLEGLAWRDEKRVLFSASKGGGEHILFCGNEPSKPTRCYKQAIAGGPPALITPDNIVNAYVAPDGDKLLALDAGGVGQVISIASGSSQPAKGLRPDDLRIRWASDSLSFFVQKSNLIPAPIERVYLQSGKRELVREINPPDRAGFPGIYITDVIGDGAGYVHTNYRFNTTLFVIQGVK